MKTKGKVKKKKTDLVITRELNPRQELFCKLYASNEEFFGSGVKSYAKAYDLNLGDEGDYNLAKSNAYKLLTNAYILDKIDQLLDHTLNTQIVIKELTFLIKQKANLSAKSKGIEIWMKVLMKAKSQEKLTDLINEQQYKRVIEEEARRIGVIGDKK